MHRSEMIWKPSWMSNQTCSERPATRPISWKASRHSTKNESQRSRASDSDMTRALKVSAVGVIGAGAMGNGIAQVAATNGHRVVLFDTNPAAVQRALGIIARNLSRLVEKNKMSAGDAEAIIGRISTASAEPDAAGLAPVGHCGLVIEAFVENLEVKRRLFAILEEVLPESAVLGTNTSSLTVTA